MRSPTSPVPGLWPGVCLLVCSLLGVGVTAARAGGGGDPATDPPSPWGSQAPDLAVGRRGLLLTWLEAPDSGGSRDRLRFSRRARGVWSEPTTVMESDRFFVNWADFPRVVETSRGEVVVHWLERTGGGAYDYAVHFARSTDGGVTWTPLGRLHDDESLGEHGFVSWVALPDSRVRAFWLDGGAMTRGGAMTLRTRILAPDRGAERLLDSRVCECCQTDAVWTHRGPVVVYRDRSAEERRDVAIVRLTHEGWSEPAPVHRDGWRISGCPVNGPAVAAGEATPDDPRGDELVAVAWFTAVGRRPRVQVAFSEDSGTSFHPPVVLDDRAPAGRVDVVLHQGEAFVSWLGGGDPAPIRLRRVARDGALGEPFTVAETSGSRRSGFPRLQRVGERLALVWVEVGHVDGPRLRFKELAVGEVPGPG